MAKLVGIFHEDADQWHFENRQLLLDIDESLTMVMQFDNLCGNFEQQPLKNKDLERFSTKFNSLSSEELSNALMVSSKELFNTLSQTVTCVGCRRSVERLYNQLSETGHRTLDPLIITVDGVLTLREPFLLESRSLCELFRLLGSKLNSLLKAIPKNKKNKRCSLHSLESQRSKLVGNWLEVWDLMSRECRDEVVLVESDVLLETLESYLRKHRFCSECKSKVMKAYDILIGRIDSKKEAGFSAQLYKGIHCCPPEKHVHVNGDTNFISKLITRAEPEFRCSTSFSTRERHAKTVENAQEEVLTCLGVCLYERLHRIWQRLHEEEQTWQILFYVGVTELRKNFELAIEAKQGYTQLERVCEELTREDMLKQHRQELKRLKKKKKKNNKLNSDGKNDDKENARTCDCTKGNECDLCNNATLTRPSYECSNLNSETVSTNCSCNQLSPNRRNNYCYKGSNCCSDSDYCSANGNESSSSSSCENSEILSSETFCDQEDESHTNTTSHFANGACERCSINLICSCLPVKWVCSDVSMRCCLFESNCGTSLQNMLEECTCGCEEEKIPPEEVREMKEKLCQINEQRQLLRQRLRQRFANLRNGRFVRTMNKI